MHTSAKLLYIQARKSHREIYEQLIKLKEDVATEVSETELADVAFALERSIRYLEDIRKELSKTNSHIKTMACLKWTENQATTMDGQPIRTAYCTATPEVKMYAPFPIKKDKDGWDELMKWLGIPKEISDKEIVRPHYPAMLELCTELSREGKPLPPGVDPSKKKAQYDLKMRKTKTEIA